MSLVKVYGHSGTGFEPLHIAANWQVAQINYALNQKIGNIKSIDIHYDTDEDFILLKGNAVLITAKRTEEGFDFFTTVMKQNLIYQVPKMCWHNIALDKNAQVLIVEDKNSHLEKYKIQSLCEIQNKQLNNILREAIIDMEWEL